MPQNTHAPQNPLNNMRTLDNGQVINAEWSGGHTVNISVMTQQGWKEFTVVNIGDMKNKHATLQEWHDWVMTDWQDDNRWKEELNAL